MFSLWYGLNDHKGLENINYSIVYYSEVRGDVLRPPSGPEVIKLFSCSTQLSMKFSLLINMKMPTIVGIFIFISREIFMFRYV